MKNQLINFIFLLVFLIGSMSFSPVLQEDGGGIVIVNVKTSSFEFQIPEKFVFNNQLTTSMVVTFDDQSNGNVYSMCTTSMTVNPSWNLNGNFELKLEIGEFMVLQEVHL